MDKQVKVMIILVIGLFLTTALAKAETVTNCYESACATISVADCVSPDTDFDVYVQGEIEGGSSWTVTAYSIYENAEWFYTDQHMVTAVSGIFVDGKGFNWGNSYTNTYTFNKPVGTYKYTFIFGSRDFSHGYYDTAVDVDIKFCSLSTDIAVDIKPQSCPNPLNVRGKGVLPAAIVGSKDFDVTQVDISSVQLVGVYPIRYSLEDVTAPYEPFIGKELSSDCTEDGPDGILDLTMQFDTQEIVQAIEASLGRELEDGEELLLPLTGDLIERAGGVSTINGEDIVILLKKGKK